MRRGLLGYRRGDVERALADRDEAAGELAAELDARDAELAELRQDIAALWLAFAQHDRTLGQLRDEITAAGPPAESEHSEPSGEEPGSPAPADSVGRRLADLDDVLSAIEMATQRLEQTYAEEIEEAEVPSDGD